MKIAVFSDTHGLAQGMIDAVREYRPDQVIHLGDGMRDAERLMREFPEIPVCTVPGNCDYDSYGCSGGTPTSAYYYMKYTGIPDESCLPLTGTQERCEDVNICRPQRQARHTLVRRRVQRCADSHVRSHAPCRL